MVYVLGRWIGLRWAVIHYIRTFILTYMHTYIYTYIHSLGWAVGGRMLLGKFENVYFRLGAGKLCVECGTWNCVM